MPGGRFGDQLVVVGRHGTADADRSDDDALLHERNRSPAEHEAVVSKGGHVGGEQLAGPAEPFLQIRRGGAEGGGRIGLGPGDVRRHP